MSSPVGFGDVSSARMSERSRCACAKIKKAASEFESLLVKADAQQSKIAGDENGERIADMAVDAMASAVEKGGGFGLVRRIEAAIGPMSACPMPRMEHQRAKGSADYAVLLGRRATVHPRNPRCASITTANSAILLFSRLSRPRRGWREGCGSAVGIPPERRGRRPPKRSRCLRKRRLCRTRRRRSMRQRSSGCGAPFNRGPSRSTNRPIAKQIVDGEVVIHAKRSVR